MSLFKSNGRHRKQATIGMAAVLGVAGIAAAAIAFSSGSSEAAESCQGLDTALQNNLNFIAGQQANPDAQSEARIANRQAVVDQIQSRRQAAGCNGNVVANPAAAQAAVSGESCAGLDQALQNNLNFIAGQKANPDAQSQARIANRQAVVDLIQQRRQAAGCNGNVAAQPPAQNNGGANNGGNAGGGAAQQPPAQQQPPANNGGGNAGGGEVGEVVCAGNTVTLSGEAGAPAASSSEFPVGTQLKVTNLDNNKSTTVEVTGVSGSCALLNNAAFEQVREPGKFLIRRAKIERVG